MENEEFKEKVEETKEKVADFAEDAKEKISDFAEDAKEKFSDLKSDVKEKLEEATCEADAQTGVVYHPEDIKNNKVMAVLAYLGVLVLIPMFLANKSRYAKFHTNQGVILLVIEIVACLLGYIPVIRIIGRILGILTFVFAIIGIINAVKGEAKELPYIGHFRFIK